MCVLKIWSWSSDLLTSKRSTNRFWSYRQPILRSWTCLLFLIILMAAPCISSKFDVFLSFRGEDTRQSFTSHLYTALCWRGIRVFLDDEGIKRGDDLSPTLEAAIAGSKISIVILSENYANSKWCLNELEKIMECRITRGQIVLPIFYNVDPSNVRKQTGKYKTAFVEHEKYSPSKVQEWRAALREVAILAGWDSRNTRLDSDLVKVVIEDVLQKLDYIMGPLIPSGLVGIEKRIAEVESLLYNDRSNDVCMIGLHGMGGVGKTTIAEILFQKHFSHFEGHFFLDNVRERCEKSGVNHVRNELWARILGDQSPNINYNLVLNRLRQKKILMVLDDVSDWKQLEYLIGEKEWYGAGSKIIVTTRDKSVLQKDFDRLYNVMPLDNNEARRLFCLRAFKQDFPKIEFIQQVDAVVDYARGNPLALKVLGSILYSKNKMEWESALQKLKKAPNAVVYRVLRLSYQELDYEEQSMFLDIACFLKGEKKGDIIRFLDACNLSAEIGLRTLLDKSLITLKKDQTIWMHDLIQQVGQHIVREESIKMPEERSRLCDPKEVYDVFRHNKGTQAIEGILLNQSQLSKDLSLSSDAFAKMNRLRILKFYVSCFEKKCNVHIPKGIEVLPAELRYVRWDCFPRQALSTSFNTENLVKLDLRNSLVEKLWHGEKDLANLKSLNLSGSKQLLELPDLSKADKLEELHLGFCTSLLEVASYVLSLDHLLAINLEGCTELQSNKSDIHSKSLRWLNLSGCSKLVEFSVTSEKLEYLSLKDTAIQEFPSSIWQNKNLYSLYLSGCLRLKKLPPIVGTSLSISRLYLNGCSNLSKLPDNLNLLGALNTLSLQGSCIETLPGSTKHLSQLRSLNVSHCKRLRSLPELPLLLRHLDATGCTSLETVSSSAATTLLQDSLYNQNGKLSLVQHQELKFFFCPTFKFNNCRGLDVNARNIIVDETITRIKYAAYLSSVAQGDPYYQFQIFSKDYDDILRGSVNIPNWFQIQERESSSVIIKVNANCCSVCKSSNFGFGLFRTDKEEDPQLKFSGRHRVCVKQIREDFIRLFGKLWFNDVSVCLPGSRIPSCFRYPKRDHSRVAVELPRYSDLLGFAFCVISSHLPSTDEEYHLHIICECHLDDVEWIKPFRSYCYAGGLKWEFMLDNAFLWYDAYISYRILEAVKESRDADQSTTDNPRLSFKFYSRVMIEECGVWPIYASDLESERLSLMRSRL